MNAARNELHGLLRFAREQAIVRGSNAMLIINYDKSDSSKFLRYAGVIVEEEYQSGGWLAAHQGIYLPEGVYFVPQTVDSLTDGFTFDDLWPPAGVDPDMRSGVFLYGWRRQLDRSDRISGSEFSGIGCVTGDEQVGSDINSARMDA